MTDTTQDLPSYATYARDQYRETVKKAARVLRDAADSFERRALDVDGTDHGTSSDKFKMGYAAARAVNELHWAIANAHVDTALIDAATADHAAREENDRG